MVIEQPVPSALGGSESFTEIVMSSVQSGDGMRVKSGYLTRLNPKQRIVIKATAGDELIAQAANRFGHIDPEFSKGEWLEPSSPTQPTAITFFRLDRDGGYPSIANDFGVMLPQWCFTQSQVRMFCESRQELITATHRILFLIRNRREYAAIQLSRMNNNRISIEIISRAHEVTLKKANAYQLAIVIP